MHPPLEFWDFKCVSSCPGLCNELRASCMLGSSSVNWATAYSLLLPFVALLKSHHHLLVLTESLHTLALSSVTQTFHWAIPPKAGNPVFSWPHLIYFSTILSFILETPRMPISLISIWLFSKLHTPRKARNLYELSCGPCNVSFWILCSWTALNHCLFNSRKCARSGNLGFLWLPRHWTSHCPFSACSRLLQLLVPLL